MSNMSRKQPANHPWRRNHLTKRSLEEQKKRQAEQRLTDYIDQLVKAEEKKSESP